jgi:hypothetical protein
MAALHRVFSDRGMMFGTTSSYMAGVRAKDGPQVASGSSDVVGEEDDESAEPGNPVSGALSIVTLAARFRMSFTSHSHGRSNPNFI